DWEKSASPPAWTVLEPLSATAANGTILAKQTDNSLLASGKNPSPETYTITATTKLAGITAFRLEVLSDPSLPGTGPGRAPNGNFVLNEFKVTVAQNVGPPKPILLHNARADFSQQSFAVAGAIDGNDQTGWAIAPAFGKNHVAIFETKEPLGSANGSTLTFALEQKFGKGNNLGRFRLSVTAAKPPIQLDGLPEPIAKILAIAPDQRAPKQKAELTQYYRSIDKELARLTQAVAEHPKPFDKRLLGAQDLAWALLNSPAFLFNH